MVTGAAQMDGAIDLKDLIIATDQRARAARPSGERAEDRRFPEQVRHGGRSRDARPGRDGGSRPAFEIRVRR